MSDRYQPIANWSPPSDVSTRYTEIVPSDIGARALSVAITDVQSWKTHGAAQLVFEANRARGLENIPVGKYFGHYAEFQRVKATTERLIWGIPEQLAQLSAHLLSLAAIVHDEADYLGDNGMENESEWALISSILGLRYQVILNARAGISLDFAPFELKNLSLESIKEYVQKVIETIGIGEEAVTAGNHEKVQWQVHHEKQYDVFSEETTRIFSIIGIEDNSQLAQDLADACKCHDLAEYQQLQGKPIDESLWEVAIALLTLHYYEILKGLPKLKPAQVEILQE